MVDAALTALVPIPHGQSVRKPTEETEVTRQAGVIHHGPPTQSLAEDYPDALPLWSDSHLQVLAGGEWVGGALGVSGLWFLDPEGRVRPLEVQARLVQYVVPGASFVGDPDRPVMGWALVGIAGQTAAFQAFQDETRGEPSLGFPVFVAHLGTDTAGPPPPPEWAVRMRTEGRPDGPALKRLVEAVEAAHGRMNRTPEGGSLIPQEARLRRDAVDLKVPTGPETRLVCKARAFGNWEGAIGDGLVRLRDGSALDVVVPGMDSETALSWVRERLSLPGWLLGAYAIGRMVQEPGRELYISRGELEGLVLGTRREKLSRLERVRFARTCHEAFQAWGAVRVWGVHSVKRKRYDRSTHLIVYDGRAYVRGGYPWESDEQLLPEAFTFLSTPWIDQVRAKPSLMPGIGDLRKIARIQTGKPSGMLAMSLALGLSAFQRMNEGKLEWETTREGSLSHYPPDFDWRAQLEGKDPGKLEGYYQAALRILKELEMVAGFTLDPTPRYLAESWPTLRVGVQLPNREAVGLKGRSPTPKTTARTPKTTARTPKTTAPQVQTRGKE